jgi:hypothetical protein
MPIELDWEVTDAPSAGEPGTANSADKWALTASNQTSTQSAITDRRPASPGGPADPRSPHGLPAPHRRVIFGVAAFVAVLVAVVGAGLNAFMQGSWQRLSDDIAALVRYEERFSYLGQFGPVLQVQDPGNSDWIAVRRVQLRSHLPAALPIPMLQTASEDAEVADLEMLDPDWVKVDVKRQYLTPEGQTMVFTVPQFYRRAGDSDWLRSAPPGGFWGEWTDWQTATLHIRHSERDAEFVRAIGPQLADLLQEACSLWPADCAGLAPAKVYLSGFVGSLEYDPVRNVRVLVQFGDGSKGLPSDYFISVPSPHLAGIPDDEAGQRYLVEYLAVRMIAAMARDAASTNAAARSLFNLAVSNLGLRHADPGFSHRSLGVAMGAGNTRSPVLPVPPSSAVSAEAAPVAPPAPQQQVFVHIVQQGETLGGIAALYGVPLHSLVTLNAVGNPNHIEVGEQLIIWRRGAE